LSFFVSIIEGCALLKKKKNKKNDGGARKNEKEVCFLFFGYDISSCSQLDFSTNE